MKNAYSIGLNTWRSEQLNTSRTDTGYQTESWDFPHEPVAAREVLIVIRNGARRVCPNCGATTGWS